MKKMKNKILIGIIYTSCFLSLSCVSKLKKEDTQKAEIIKVYETRIPELQSSKLLNSIEYIPLETREECLIGKIDKMQCFNNAIYILDTNSAKKIFVFELSGKYKFSINNYGRGPGEYSNIIDFSIDENNGHVFVLDFPYKISEYDEKGVYIKKHQLPNTNKDITRFGYNRNNFYLYTNRLNRNVNPYSILRVDKNMIVNGNYLKFEMSCDHVFDFKNIIYSYKGNIEFFDVFEGKIYENINDKMELKYIFDFDGRYMPIEMLCKHSVFMEKYKDYSIMQNILVEGDSVLYYLILDEYKYKHGLYNKITRKNVLIEKVVTDKDILRIPECFYNKYFYSYLEPITIIDNSNHFHGLDKKLGIDVNDNPILIKYKFKNVW